MKNLLLKNKKSIIYLILAGIAVSIFFSFLLNLGFLITDWIANKQVDWNGLFYSPIPNETWLAFWGSFSASIATILLLFHYKNELNFEKKKYYSKSKLDELEKEKQIISNLMSVYDIGKISNFSQVCNLHAPAMDSIKELLKINQEIIKDINLNRLNLELLTKLRINVEKVDYKNYNPDEYQNLYLNQQKSVCYDCLTAVHNFYSIFIDDGFNRSKKFLDKKYHFEHSSDKDNSTKINDIFYEMTKEKQLNFLFFLKENRIFLKKYFDMFFSHPDLFLLDSTHFQDACIKHNLKKENLDFISELFIEFYPNFNLNNFEKINFEIVVLPIIFIKIFNQLFTDTTNNLVIYYHNVENNIFSSIN